MSALDRAFIRAYHRPTAPERGELGESPTVPHKGTFTGGPAVPLSRALADLAVASEPVSSSIGTLLDEAMQTEASRSSAAEEPMQKTVIRRFDPPAAAKEVVAIATTTDHLPLPAQDVTTGPAAAPKAWSPLLQVDRVVWPAIHSRLQGTAQAAIAQMTDGLQAIGDSGRKIIGLASCSRGEGVTTLLSAAARKLLERGRKVAVVDSHWNNPQLARSLGLLPQIGWEASLCGGLPLEEVVIESLADGLAVLPVREPPASGVTQAAAAAGLETLAQNYDFVLVDLGPLDELAEEGKPARHVAARMDALVLVQNVRVTPPHRLAEFRKHMAAANVRYAGTIQNFVAG